MTVTQTPENCAILDSLENGLRAILFYGDYRDPTCPREDFSLAQESEIQDSGF